MRRRLWMVLVALLVVLAAGDWLAWRFAVQQIRAGLNDWMMARRATGWTVSTALPQAGGWPLTATLTLRDVRLQGGTQDIPGGLAWQAEQVVLLVALLHPQVLQVDAAGTQHIRLADGPDIPFTAGRLQLLVPLQPVATTQAADLHGEALRAQLPAPGGSDALTVERLDVHAVLAPAAGQGQPALSASIAAAEIGLPARLKWPLGPKIASLSGDAALNGPLPSAAGVTARAAAWRDDGGSVEVPRMAMHWGPLGLTGTATLALDPELQPMGTGTAEVTGYAETLDAFARNGLMSRAAATTAKAVLSLLANSPDDNGPSEVEVPLSLQYRTLSMRQVPLVRFPELDWPQQ